MLLIGLGNPGKKYKNTRHNAGFILLDELRKEWHLPEFELNKKFNAKVSEGIIRPPLYLEKSEGIKIILAKPQMFMNNSGESVRKFLDFYKLTPSNIIVIHDDMDIEVGKYKISENSSAAGHNGVQDIIDKLGTQNFKRIRLGVEIEGGRQNRIFSGKDFVLRDFSKEEMEKIKNIKNSINQEIKNLQ